MPPKKTPTSSLPASELLAKRFWYRTKARIHKVYHWDTSPEASMARTSPATKLPLEVVEKIIANLHYDIYSLLACTLTCYPWYIAAVPHLHHNLFIGDSWGPKCRWPNRLRPIHRLGLLPLVKTLWVRGTHGHAFSQTWFNSHILHQFSALSNVQRLMIDHLDIPSFMPRIQQYFGHFLPTVQELCLTNPNGSHRQIIYFIGLFQHLEDLNLIYIESGELTNDLALFPFFTPPLRGWLKLTCVRRVELLKDMIDLFGGLRFRWMDLFDVDGRPLLLGACANTLEILRLYPADPRFSSSLQDFDLSRNKSLRALQIMASSICHLSSNDSLDATSNFLNHTLSTVTSPEFYQVIVIYFWSDFFVTESWENPDRPPLREISRAERAQEVLRHRRMFEAFRRIHKARGFRFQLCANIWDPVGEYSVGILKDAIAEETANGGFDGFSSIPFVTYEPRNSHL